MKKLLISFLASLVLFFSIAPYFSANAQGRFSCDWNGSINKCRVISQSCNSGYSVDPNFCDKLTTPTSCKGQSSQCAAGNSPVPLNSSAPSTAQWYNQSFGDWFAKVYDPKNGSEIFGERYTAAQVQWVVYGIWSFILNSVIGPKGGAIVACFFSAGAAATSAIPSAVTGGAIQSSQASTSCLSQLPSILTSGLPSEYVVAQKNENLWSLVFATNRPLSGIGYVKDKISNFSLVPPVHAQTVGFGFNALKPIQDMWAAVRDISYGLFVIAAVVFAFMIMFRVKINPQTVITVQSAIPKIIFALILVTFSYAIAGFLIDLMYIFIGLISLVGSRFVGAPPSNVFNFLTLGQPVGWNIQIGVFASILTYLVLFFVSLIILILLGFTGGLTTAGIILGGIISNVGTIFMMIVIIIAALIAIWVSIKTVWSLLKAFASVILLTIFAPIQIAAGTIIPSLGFGSWIKGYVSALSTFVVTGVLLLFSFIFLMIGIKTGLDAVVTGDFGNIVSKFLFGTAQVTNPFSGSSNAWPPLLGAGNAGWLGLIFLGVSFVLFTMIPKANEIIQGILSGKPFAYGTAIGEAIAPVTTLGRLGVARGIDLYEEERRKTQKNYQTPALLQVVKTILGIKS